MERHDDNQYGTDFWTSLQNLLNPLVGRSIFQRMQAKPWLGKCQAQDFDAQIAATTLCMMQYNLLSVVKRLNDYETLGELFRTAQKDSLKITIADRYG